ncbi:MAG: alpha/beta hydrolase [Myxococcota bacterium]|nr:alpha/beta hydrolase [Myxococcota bacterium]
MTPGSLALAAALVVSSIACGSSTPPASSPSTAPAEARVSSADGVSIHYVAEGSGPAVVLAHCLDCNLHYWDVVAADLARDHRVIRLDLAGNGGSGSNRKTWSIENFVGDIRAVLNAAGVDRFTLVGHSMSGTIALETARQLGERVTGVVPIDSVLDVDAHMPAEMRVKMLAELRADYRGFIEKQLPSLLPTDPDPKVVARVRGDALAGDPARSSAILASLFSYREDLAMDRLAMPIVAVDADRRPVALDRNRAHAPQFDARVIKDTSHWLMLDKPAEFARTLREVIESIESGKARRRPVTRG